MRGEPSSHASGGHSHVSRTTPDAGIVSAWDQASSDELDPYGAVNVGVDGSGSEATQPLLATRVPPATAGSEITAWPSALAAFGTWVTDTTDSMSGRWSMRSRPTDHVPPSTSDPVPMSADEAVTR